MFLAFLESLMTHPLTKTALGLALGFFLASPASAVLISPPTTVLGTFANDDDVQQFEFNLGTNSLVTFETVSYAGGDSVAFPGVTIPDGGFDPFLWVFDDIGTLIDAVDDGSPNVDPNTGAAFDSFLQSELTAGDYSVVVTQFGNFFNGLIGDNIALGFSQVGDPGFTSAFGCGGLQFCDITGAQRNNRFALNVSATAVPEPSALALLGFGLVGAGLAYRRRLQG